MHSVYLLTCTIPTYRDQPQGDLAIPELHACRLALRCVQVSHTIKIGSIPGKIALLRLRLFRFVQMLCDRLKSDRNRQTCTWQSSITAPQNYNTSNVVP